MAKYALKTDGILTGWSRWPNGKNGELIDEESQEWLDFIAIVPPKETFPTLKAIIDQMEIDNPGFKTRAKATYDAI